LASVVSSNLYDVFGVLRYAQTPWRWRYVTVAEEGLTTLDGLYVQPKAAITTLGFFTLPGIGIGLGMAICIYQAWRYVTSPGFGIGFSVDNDKLKHCFFCCRLVRCTLGLGSNLAFWLQILWELPFLNRRDLEDAIHDTNACVTGIGIGYIIAESCLSGCAHPVSSVVGVVTPFLVRAMPPSL